MTSPLETQLTNIFRKINLDAYAMVTSKNESKTTTTENTVFNTQQFYQVWYTTDPSNLKKDKMQATKVAEVQPHKVTVYTNRFDVETQKAMLEALNSFANQSLHDQLDALNIKANHS